MNKKQLQMMLALAVSAVAPTYGQQTLDNFTNAVASGATFTNNAPTTTLSAIATGGTILGGERDVRVTISPSASNTHIGIGNSFNSGGGNNWLSISTGPAGVINNAVITWDGVDNNASTTSFSPGLGGISMMGKGSFRMPLELDYLPAGGTFTVTFRVYSDATHWSDAVTTINGAFTGGRNFIIDQARTSFVAGSGAAGAANFASVRAVQLLLSSSDAGVDAAVGTGGITVPSATLAAPILSNIRCSQNANVNSASDDYIQFNLLGTRPNDIYTEPNSLTVTATQNGSPVAVTLQDGTAATNIKYFNNFAVPLRLANGTAGNGNVIVTATPNWGSYPGAVVTLTDPGSCSGIPVCSQSTAPITYSYETMRGHTDYDNRQVHIPKFDASNGKVLTGVTATFTTTTWSNAIAENFANGGPHQYRGRMLDTNQFFLNGALTHKFLDGDTVYRTTGFPEYQYVDEDVQVPAIGMWSGDSLMGTTITNLRTLPKMRWVSSSNFYGYNPTLSPLWVTNLTGDATSDDDMFYVEGDKTRTATKVYTAAEFAAFTGTGNIPMTFRNQADFLFNLGGGNNEILLRSTNNLKVTITYTYTEPCFTLSGNVYNDGNGNTNNLVNHTYSSGIGLGNPDGVQLYANLLDEKGNVVDYIYVDPATGNYEFNDIKGGTTFTVQISTNMGTVGQPAPATTLPTNWRNTGEQLGTVANTGIDATTDGRLTVSVAGTNVSNVNFGINKIPTADLKTYTFTTTPTSGTTIALDGTNSTYGATPGLLSGNDREDGAKGNATSKFAITSLPTNGLLKYWNGTTEVTITAADVTNGTVFTNPANLRFLFVAQNGNWTSTTFQYAFVDNANMTGNTNTYTINLAGSPLPVDLLSFNAIAKGCDVNLNWTTANEQNLTGFDIEFGTDGKQFKNLNRVLATGENDYNYTNNQTEKTGYYRLKMQDNDGSFNYSSTLKVATQCSDNAISVYPNPAHTQLNVKGLEANSKVTIINALGQQVIKINANGQSVQMIDVSGFANGLYTIEVISGNSSKYAVKFTKKD